MAYVYERFEDLDVMNYFMFNKLTTEIDVAEDFCRCLIKNLLGIDVRTILVQAEKMELPDNPNKRGVRLDVKVDEMADGNVVATIYDIEPHKDVEKDYPKKNRFQQAQIDKNNLESGEKDFSKLPELYIICITNYDPFGKDQMIYTIKNTCVEVPELVYNDGVHIMYFYTKGKIGGTKSLQNFLKYIEDSKKINVVDAATEELDKYTETIKHNYEIGGKYMTVGDYIDRIVEDAVAQEKADREVEFAEIEAKLTDAKAKLTDAKAELTDAKAELTDTKAELTDTKAELADTKAELANKKTELADRDAKITEIEAELNAIKKELEELKNNINK